MGGGVLAKERGAVELILPTSIIWTLKELRVRETRSRQTHSFRARLHLRPLHCCFCSTYRLHFASQPPCPPQRRSRRRRTRTRRRRRRTGRRKEAEEEDGGEEEQQKPEDTFYHPPPPVHAACLQHRVCVGRSGGGGSHISPE